MKERTYDFFDYLAMRGDLSFLEAPFNSVDALLLCQITYNNIDGLVSEKITQKQTLKELFKNFKNSADYKTRCQMGAMINPLTPLVLEKASESKRFSDVKISGFINIIDEEKKEQFAAATYELSETEHVICFRGTDDTIVGWYEDFNLGYMNSIPSYSDADNYVFKALDQLKGNIILAGHSKGAHVAVKASMDVVCTDQERITSVYNFDGPGFSKDVINSSDFAQIKDKLFSYYPECCVVGMLFEHPEKYTIIKSSENGVMQHDPISWNVLGSGFNTANKFDEKAVLLYESFNEWVTKLSVEERKQFVETFFDIVYASGVKTNYEIEQNKIICGTKMLAKLADLEETERDSVIKGIYKMIEAVKGNLPMLSVFDPKLLVREQLNKLRR